MKTRVMLGLCVLIVASVLEAGGVRESTSSAARHSSYLPSGPSFKEVIVAKVKETDGKEFVLRTNIYLPSQPTSSPAPLVLFIHGHGGAYNFSNGSRSYELSIALKDRGIAVATVDYRPSGDALLNTYDVKAYVRFFRSHAKEYNIDPQRIGVWGTSRGGHLTAMVAATGDVKELEGDVGGNTEHSSAVQCAVIYYPITDVFLQPQIPSWFLGSNDSDSTKLKELNAKNNQNDPLWKFVELGRKVNPIQYVSEQDPPVLIAVSAKDPVTPMAASWALYQKYIEKGVDATFCSWSHGTHGIVGTDIETGTQDWITKKLTVDLLKK